MRKRICILTLGMLLLFTGVPLSAVPQWKTLTNSTDLPEDFCSAWQKGDVMLSFGSHLQDPASHRQGVRPVRRI